MTTSAEQEGKRRGRRPAGADTKNALIEAARAVFIEQGYEGATVRAIAKRAGVDPAMVNHWFGGKEGLFGQSVLQLPVDPTVFANEISEGDVNTLGERIVRRFLTIWDSSGGGQFSALVRSVASHEMAVHGLRDIFLKQIFMRVAARTGSDNGMFRATLVASQLIGMGMVRYVTKFEPLASNDIDTMVAAVGPTIQRYFTGDIG
ncbi:TetR/AcrR family transcriptional regulator [Kibdelosporangium phytohabitans]|uniref:TetR family transcriptional regulator n=1 Tax=Kibdelosporangium phytohabitans TaxID=860235 RepID=A0A0N9ICS0_9PSEU|nr:TetR family transcriptional regulator [Kibdelosporangium phytohabitans]ALG12793.1 TetR family transcriptional regulator [Kibdelosporangium phytohabitans]MBE1464473.1 AcrR family transcriptional regulator [Kibdelosporangium phytohabitans]